MSANKSVGERIKMRRKELKMSAEDVARKLDKHKTTVYRYESDDIQNMPYDVLIPISEVLRTNPLYLMGITEDKDMTMSDYNKNGNEVCDSDNTIKLYGSIAAGQPLEAIEDIGQIACPWLNVKDCTNDLFALKVNGDSMDRVVHDGYYAVFKKQEEVNTGEIAAVFVNGGDATLKKIHILSNKIILEPLSHNKEHTEQIYTENDIVRVIGKYVGCVSPLQD